MQIEDTIFDDNVFINTPDPYQLVLEIRDLISEFGKIREKKNVYETDGPRNRTEAVFVIDEIIDKYSSVNFKFILRGESNSHGFLIVEIKGRLRTKISDIEGMGSQSLSEFYIENIFPIVRRSSEERIKNTSKKIAKSLMELRQRYSMHS